MPKYRITVSGSYAGAATVEATTPSVAIKRLLDGGHAAGYKFATVGPNRVTLKPGAAITVRCERLKKGDA